MWEAHSVRRLFIPGSQMRMSRQGTAPPTLRRKASEKFSDRLLESETTNKTSKYISDGRCLSVCVWHHNRLNQERRTVNTETK